MEKGLCFQQMVLDQLAFLSGKTKIKPHSYFKQKNLFLIFYIKDNYKLKDENIAESVHEFLHKPQIAQVIKQYIEVH